MKIDDSVKTIKFVGDKRALLYKKLGIETVIDLLRHFPRSYIDFKNASTIASFAIGSTATIRAKIVEKSPPILIKGSRTIYRVVAEDEEQNAILISFFNNKYVHESLITNEEYIFHGKLSGNIFRPEMVSPIFFHKDLCPDMQPNYPLTAGLNHKMISTNVKFALENLSSFPATCLPNSILVEEGFSNNLTAYNDIHFPTNLIDAEKAKELFVLEEILCLQLGLYGLKRRKKKKSNIRLCDYDLSPFINSLPFELTNGQKKVISQAIKDMQSQNLMNRLLQGDVGSGKTVIAAALLYLIAQNGWQGAIMAPTQILAIQHYNTLSAQLSKFNIKVEILTGSMTAKQKREALERIKNGDADIICGTHALIDKDVEFKNLALVITDEQHRFGVLQRSALISKGNFPHTLVMSATPIPRSLALTIYGDLDISVLNEFPKGKKSVKTYLINQDIRERALGFIESEVRKGFQAYIVCPSIDETKLEVESAIQYKAELEKRFKNINIGLLHGKMKSTEKDNVMNDFKNKKLDILVSTTVIEVGIDVPNATIMMIENADRFGLSQLHQLRGRVGRGCAESHCILVSNNASESATERLSIMKNTYDGFEIAKFDLKQRGPGDFFGTKQHGLPELKVADLLTDVLILEKAQKYATEILKKDPLLSNDENKVLKDRVNSMFKNLNHSTNN